MSQREAYFTIIKINSRRDAKEGLQQTSESENQYLQMEKTWNSVKSSQKQLVYQISSKSTSKTHPGSYKRSKIRSWFHHYKETSQKLYPWELQIENYTGNQEEHIKALWDNILWTGKPKVEIYGRLWSHYIWHMNCNCSEINLQYLREEKPLNPRMRQMSPVFPTILSLQSLTVLGLGTQRVMHFHINMMLHFNMPLAWHWRRLSFRLSKLTQTPSVPRSYIGTIMFFQWNIER